MLFFKRFYTPVIFFSLLTFKFRVNGLCKDVCNAVDRYTLVCEKVIKRDIHDCHRKHSEISSLRLNWYSLNQSDINRRDFFVFSNLSDILIEPSNTTGFSTRIISAEEYENPKLWTTYKAIGVFGRVLNIRIFDAFRQESCCNKWLSRMVLGHLIPTEATLSWFKHCFAGFNLFCRVNATAPPRWMILAWIESSHELKGLMENYCKFSNRKSARFKRHLPVRQTRNPNFGNDESPANDETGTAVIFAQSAYKREGVKHKRVAPKEPPQSQSPLDNGDRTFKEIALISASISIALLFSLMVTCCLYCNAKGALDKIGIYNDAYEPWQKFERERAHQKNVSSNVTDGPVPQRTNVAPDHTPYENSSANRRNSASYNNDLEPKELSKDTLQTQSRSEEGNKKFVGKLRKALGLRRSDSTLNQFEERERLVPRGFNNNDQNNNNTINQNFSNSTIRLNNETVQDGSHSYTENNEDESENLSDEEELEQIFLDHLYNRMRTQTRYEYLSKFDKYGYACNH